MMVALLDPNHELVFHSCDSKDAIAMILSGIAPHH
jgi:hypothetical protein